MAKGKVIKAAYEKIDREKEYTLDKAIEVLKETGKNRNFDETIEVAVNLGVDPRHSDQMVRGMFSPPHGTGSSVRVAVFARDEKAEEAKKAGADIVGAEDLAEKVQNGEIDFDRCVATPDMMPLVGRLGKILGPKGLMPNPKLGTVTPDVTQAVEDAKGGAVEYRVEKAGILHVPLGKLSFSEKEIRENVIAFINEIKRVRPSGIKGAYMQKVTLTSTMGPGIKIDVSDFDEKSIAA